MCIISYRELFEALRSHGEWVPCRATSLVKLPTMLKGQLATCEVLRLLLQHTPSSDALDRCSWLSDRPPNSRRRVTLRPVCLLISVLFPLVEVPFGRRRGSNPRPQR